MIFVVASTHPVAAAAATAAATTITTAGTSIAAATTRTLVVFGGGTQQHNNHYRRKILHHYHYYHHRFFFNTRQPQTQTQKQKQKTLMSMSSCGTTAINTNNGFGSHPSLSSFIMVPPSLSSSSSSSSSLKLKPQSFSQQLRNCRYQPPRGRHHYHYYNHQHRTHQQLMLFHSSFCSRRRRDQHTHSITQDINVQQQQRRDVSTLVLLRHGQSQWNGPNARFTGWCDVPLTTRGRVEAVQAGSLMRSRGFKASRVCIAFASELQRSHETCELALASMAGQNQHTWSSSRIRRDWRLNERHYGAVQGKFKEDPELIAQYGQETLRNWRRSLRGKPPPMTEDHEYYLPPPAPLTESLEDCQKRAVECWHDAISPALFEEEGHPYTPDERTILVVAHANTIRSLIAHFDQVPEHRVPRVYVPNSVPILYRFDTTTRQPLSVKLEAGYGGSHARWMLSAENHQAVRKSVQQGGVLTRALFESFGADAKDLTITGRELENGVRQMIKEQNDHSSDGAEPIDCVVIGVAKRVARKLNPDDVIGIKEFEKMCQEGVDGLSLRKLNDDDYMTKRFEDREIEWY